MTRVAVLMDRTLGKFGLHGRSIIPLLTGFGCAIPAITSLRTIPVKKDRLTAMLVIPLIPCSARIPVYTLIIGTFIPNHSILGIDLKGFVLFLIYLLGVVSAIGFAFLFKRVLIRGPKSPLLIELPSYHPPRFKILIRRAFRQTRSFVEGAGGQIVKIMVVIWALCTFPLSKGLPDIQGSFAHSIAVWIEPIFQPIGFNWMIIIALIAGLVAREVSIGVLASLYAFHHQSSHDLSVILSHEWSFATAISLLIWYVFAPQCLSTLITARKESKSLFWPAFMFVYMFLIAYLASFITFQLLSRFTPH